MTALGPDDRDPSNTSRRGWSGWLRALGFADWHPPRWVWRVQHVVVVGDDRELTSYIPGPRASAGGTRLAVVADFSVFQLLGGTTGARAAYNGSVNTKFMVDAPRTLNNNTNLPIHSSEPARPATSRAQSGSLLAEPEPTGNAATILGTTGWAGAPTDIWVPPGRALIVWTLNANATLNCAFLWKEPGSPTRGQPL